MNWIKKYRGTLIAMIPTFLLGLILGFNIKQDCGALAEWLSAFGTVAAVVVALWQSLRKNHNVTFAIVKDKDQSIAKEYRHILEIKNFSQKMKTLVFRPSEKDEVYDERDSHGNIVINLWPLGTNDHKHEPRTELMYSIRDMQWLALKLSDNRKLVFKEQDSCKKYKFKVKLINGKPFLNEDK